MKPARKLLSSREKQINMSRTDQVRDIGGRKELFIDEAPVASMKNVRLTMNAPYQDHEPVFLPQAPWEYRIHPYATVMREGDVLSALVPGL